MPSPVSSHLAAHSRQAQTTNAEGAPCQLDFGLCYGLGSPTAPSRQAQTTNAEGASCQLDIGLCYRLGSPTAHLGQAQKTNAKRATLLAGLRPLLQPGFPNLFKSKLQRGRRRLYWKLSVAVTDYIISVHDCKSYTINAVSGFTKKYFLVMHQAFFWCPVTRILTENLPVSFTPRNQKGTRTQ